MIVHCRASLSKQYIADLMSCDDIAALDSWLTRVNFAWTNHAQQQGLSTGCCSMSVVSKTSCTLPSRIVKFLPDIDDLTMLTNCSHLFGQKNCYSYTHLWTKLYTEVVAESLVLNACPLLNYNVQFVLFVSSLPLSSLSAVAMCPLHCLCSVFLSCRH